MFTVGIVGAGSIGSTLAAGFDQLGHTVLINDTDPDQCNDLPYPSHPKRELSTLADYLIFALPTPTTNRGGDASIVDAALREFQDTTATCILRSTMPPGTTQPLADKYGLPLVYSPEFLRDRSDVEDFFCPDRIVLAGPRAARQRAWQLLDDPMIDCDTVIETSDYLTAEIGKEAHNAFFATKVSFANQLRLICEQEGADVETAMDIVTADHRNTTSHLDPLLGPYGGKCLPKDTEALTHYGKQAGADVTLLRGVIDLNREARRRYENVDIVGRWPNVTVDPAPQLESEFEMDLEEELDFDGQVESD